MTKANILRCILAAVVGLCSLAASAQQPQDLSVQKLADNVYWASGGGGNSGIIIGQDGVIVVDAKTTPDAGKQLLAEIAKLTPKPVTHVILTHSDGDHVNGLASFPAGVTVIAHANNKKEQEAALQAGGRNTPPADHLPTQVVTSNNQKLTIHGVKFQLLHWAPAHTSGDLVVFLPDQKIVFTGDIIATNRPDPLIHLEKNGSSAGWITTAEGIAALNATQFVPGHGDLQSKAQIQERLKATKNKREKIASMVKQGKSLDEIKAAVDPASPGASGAGAGAPGGNRGPGFATFTDVVYRELTTKTPA